MTTLFRKTNEPENRKTRRRRNGLANRVPQSKGYLQCTPEIAQELAADRTNPELAILLRKAAAGQVTLPLPLDMGQQDSV